MKIKHGNGEERVDNVERDVDVVHLKDFENIKNHGHL